MVKKLLTSFLFSVLLMPAALMAQVSISGVVTDANSEDKLVGAYVSLGEGNVVSTNVDGRYRFEDVEPGTYTVRATYVGYKNFETTVDVGNSAITLDIEMQPDFIGVDEVYVTAYGVKKTQNELSYAAQKVSGDDITKTRTSNFAGTLTGKVAGINVKQTNSLGGSTNIILRGYSSLTGNNQPLFVVDGVPFNNSNTNSGSQQSGFAGYDYGNTVSDLNPDDIASINVLKGPSAAALYGSRAANGVIVIETKKGQKGQAVGVTYNTSVQVGMIDETTFLDYQDGYGAGYGPFYTDPNSPGGDNTPYFYEADLDGDGSEDLIVPTTEDGSYGAAFDENLMVYQWDSFNPLSPNYLTKTPWTASQSEPVEFFETALTTNNSIFIDGGTNKGYYKLGYTNIMQEGILPNSKIDKNLVNFAASYDVTSDLTVDGSLNFSQIDGKGRYGTGYASINLMTNFRQWWQTNVDMDKQKDAYFRNRRNNTWNGNDPKNASLTPIFWDNPYWTRHENYQNDSRTRYYGYFSGNYQITDWLSVLGRFSLDTYEEIQEERIAVGSIDVSQYSRFNRIFSEYNYDLIFNYNKELTDDLKVSGVFGTNIRRNEVSSINASTNGGLVVPRLYALSNTANPLNPPTEYVAETGVNGIFASANFNYDKYLVLEGTIRRDESSTLPEGNNVYYYPSVSAGFVFSEFVQNDVLSYGKLRASFAQVGNTTGAYNVSDTYVKPTAFGSTTRFSLPGTKNNPDLKPERTNSVEAGVNLGFFDGRINTDITLYRQTTVDQIIPVQISRATGYNSRFINVGEIQNQGIEVALYTRPIVTENFVWNLDINWSTNQNEVKELAEGIDNLQLASFQGGVTLNAAVGEPYGTLRGTDYVYHENGGKIVDPNSGTYQTSESNNEKIGDMNPDWLSGISNTFQYNNLSLSFLVDIRSGGDIFSLDQWYGLATGLYPKTAGTNDLGNPRRDPVVGSPGNYDASSGGVIVDGVLPNGDKNNVRADLSSILTTPYGYFNGNNAQHVYDASYVKLRNITLTYSLPQTILENVRGLNGVDLSFIANNVWIIHKNIPHADPEEQFSSGNIQGYQGGAYPTTRTFSFNMKLKF